MGLASRKVHIEDYHDNVFDRLVFIAKEWYFTI